MPSQMEESRGEVLLLLLSSQLCAPQRHEYNDSCMLLQAYRNSCASRSLQEVSKDPPSLRRVPSAAPAGGQRQRTRSRPSGGCQV